jgi:hypothetical protein
MQGTFPNQRACMNQASIVMGITGKQAQCMSMPAGGVPNPSNDGGWNQYQQCRQVGACQ